MQSARYVTRISPPPPRVPRPSSGNGFLRRRRVLVELRSPVDTRQKPIRVGSPPIARCPHNARPVLSSSHTHPISDNRAASLRHTGVSRRRQCPHDQLARVATSTSILTRPDRAPPNLCDSNRCVLQRRARFACVLTASFASDRAPVRCP